MLTKRLAIKQVKQFISDCRKLPVKIDKVILFGSFAHGKPNEFSDIDIALFSENFTDNILLNIDMIGPVNIHYPNIDVHTYPAKSFYHHGLLIDEIKRTGIVLET